MTRIQEVTPELLERLQPVKPMGAGEAAAGVAVLMLPSLYVMKILSDKPKARGEGR